MAATTDASKAPRFEAVHADASEQIAHAIRLYIERGRLQPGDRIGTEHELSREFGVSRPTLREGLRRLAGSHLIRVQKGRAGGVFVKNTPNAGIGRHVSESIAAMLESESVTLYELLEARTFLEVPLAGLAAERADEETIAALTDAIAEARDKAGDRRRADHQPASGDRTGDPPSPADGGGARDARAHRVHGRRAKKRRRRRLSR